MARRAPRLMRIILFDALVRYAETSRGILIDMMRVGIAPPSRRTRPYFRHEHQDRPVARKPGRR